MSDDRRYRIHPLDMRRTDLDEYFDDQADAEERAVLNSIDDSAWSVLDTQEDEMLSIAYGRELFSK